MSKKKKRLPESHAFGPAYSKWLDILESYEDYLADRIPLRKVKPITYNDDIFDFKFTARHPAGGAKNLHEYDHLFRIWGANAASLRSSFKFKIKSDQWEGGFWPRQAWSADELEVTTYLPFENVYIQYDKDSERSVLALCERRILERDYPEMGLVAGDTFICLTPAGFNGNGFKGERNEKLGCYPIEIHIREGLEWTAVADTAGEDAVWNWSYPVEDDNDWVPILEAIPDGVEAKNWKLQNHSAPYINALFALLTMLSAGGVKQTNHGTVKPENVIRRKPLHKKQHPMYEYRVLELGLGDEEPIVNVQIPRECGKKRLHAVRGFFRHYKKPIKSGPNKGKTKVFVREHWRGEKELGVVRKDYIFENGSEIPETV